jgi:hypothetical protein
MSLEDLERKINVNTRIITVVHWGGNPIDMDKLEAIVRNAEKMYGRPIAIIEDCAHSFGGHYPEVDRLALEVTLQRLAYRLSSILPQAMEDFLLPRLIR